MKPTSKIFWFGLAAALTSSVIVQRVQNARRWLAARSQSGSGTAVITGASAGIGAEFARRLAQDGYNLVLVARRAERLQSLAQEILAEAARTSRPVAIEILPADLADPDALKQVESRIAAIPDLALLVNNAGFGTGGKFAGVAIEPEVDMVKVHILATMRLSRAALPVLIQRGHGGIINVSSIASFLPGPNAITYSASKAFLNSFTLGLQDELNGTGVRTQVLCPGYTYSEFHDRIGFNRSRIPSFLWMQSGPVVDESLQGLREGRTMVVPGSLNKLIYFLLEGMPFRFFARLAGQVRLWMRSQRG
jgi:uncharacterized protein